MFNTVITICLFHSLIALEASIVLVKSIGFIVHFMTCMFNKNTSIAMQEFTRIIRLIHPNGISSANCFIFRIVGLSSLGLHIVHAKRSTRKKVYNNYIRM